MHRHQGRPAHDGFHGVSYSSRFVEKGGLNLGRSIRIGDNHESLVERPEIEVEDTLGELIRYLSHHDVRGDVSWQIPHGFLHRDQVAKDRMVRWHRCIGFLKPSYMFSVRQ